MKKNVGGIDKALRFIVGPALLIAAFFAPVGQTARIVMGVFGTLALVTGMVGYCPLWSIIGVNSCKECAKSQK